VANAINSSSVSVTDQTSVDSTVAAGVAAGVAMLANLSVMNNVSSLAISAQISSELTLSDSANISKPQLIESVVENRLVTNYTVVAGDTAETLAARFGISSQTIKWANNLKTDAIAVGSVIKILPINGVLYTVKSSDTLDSVAKKYEVNKTRMVLYNDLEVSGLVIGARIILPDGILPIEERPGYIAPIVYNVLSGTGFGGNTWFISYGTGPCPTYAYGNCTCYSYSRRTQLGLPVGEHWGNAESWDEYARRDGYLVDRVPSFGAIVQNHGGVGHVGIVESIAPNGDVSISEMNAHVSGGGYNIVSGRVIISGNVSQYNYIH
jgi:LysM repeat protein